MLWSPGMAAAAPMVVNPVGCRLSDLPFKDANDGSQLNRFLGQICDAPHEHDHTRTFMLHLAAQNRDVLFEMTATLIHAESGPVIVLTGRQVDANLAGLLMARKNVSVESSTNEDNDPGELPMLRSVSQSGSMDNDPGELPTLRSVSQSSSIYGDGNDNAFDGNASWATMPTVMSGRTLVR